MAFILTYTLDTLGILDRTIWLSQFSVEIFFSDLISAEMSGDNSASSLSVCLPSLPLEKRQIALPSNGSKKPAMHHDWVSSINFLTYCAPNSKQIEFMAADQIEKRLDCMISDVESILRLPHHKFWSQVYFDATFKAFLKSFLTNFPKCWDEDSESSEQITTKQMSLKQKVFLVCVRLSTYKESNEGFMSPDYFGQLHVQAGWFAPKEMANFCSIYYQQSVLLSKICESIVTNSREDFKLKFWNYSAGIIGAIQSIKRACGLNLLDPNDLSTEFNPAAGLDLYALFRMADLSLELTSNLYAFSDTVDLVLELVATKHESCSLLDELLSFVENVVKSLMWTVLQIEDHQIKSTLIQNLKLAASNVISITKLVVEKFRLANLTIENFQDTIELFDTLLDLEWTRSCFDIDTLIHDSVAQLTIFSSKKENRDKVSMSNLIQLQSRLNEEIPTEKLSATIAQNKQPSTSQNFDSNQSSEASKLLEALKKVKEIITDVDDIIIEFYLEKRNLSVDLTINDLFENNCELPAGVSRRYLEAQKSSTNSSLKTISKKSDEFSSDMQHDIVSKYGFVEDFEFDSVQKSSNKREQISLHQIRESEEANAFEYDDEYDDTYDNSMPVADSFDNKEFQFQVKNPNWGSRNWITGGGPRKAAWDFEDDEDEEDELSTGPDKDDNNQINHQNALSGNSRNSFSRGGKVGPGSRNNLQQSGKDKDVPKETFASQPKSRKSHRHTGGILDEEMARTGNEANSSLNPESQSFGGARPKQKSYQTKDYQQRDGASGSSSGGTGGARRVDSGKSRGNRNGTSYVESGKMR